MSLQRYMRGHNYTSLCHSKWSRIHSNKQNILLRCTETSYEVRMWPDSILQGTVDMRNWHLEFNLRQFPTQLQLHIKESLSDVRLNWFRHLSEDSWRLQLVWIGTSSWKWEVKETVHAVVRIAAAPTWSIRTEDACRGTAILVQRVQTVTCLHGGTCTSV